MTENKPVAWRYEYFQEIDMWGSAITEVPPEHWSGREDVRNVEPLYLHPPASQPVTDPEVEAARRKALRVIFAALSWYPYRDDGYAVPVHLAVLRDLVGEPRRDGKPVPFYDGDYTKPAPMPALKTSATLRETRVNTADLAPSARLSVDMLAEALEARHALSKGRDAADWWLLTPEGKRKWQTRAQWLIDFMREA